MGIEELKNLQQNLHGKNLSVLLIGGNVLEGLWITNQFHSVTASARMVLRTKEGQVTIPINQIKSITELNLNNQL